MSRTKRAARKGGNLKRKAQATGTEGPDHDQPAKRLRTVSDRPKQADCEETIAMMDPALLADHFGKAIRKRFADSSPLELDDLYLPTKALRNTTDFDKSHIATHLPEFLEKFTAGGKEELSRCTEGAGPHTLVITSSGIRTADLARELRVFNTADSQVAKLIAKHMKLKDNIAYMEKTRVVIAISTPMRLRDLVDADALSLEGVKRIVVDGSYQDEKKRSIFEMDELFRPLIALLNREEIRQRYGGDNAIEIMVF